MVSKVSAQKVSQKVSKVETSSKEKSLSKTSTENIDAIISFIIEKNSLKLSDVRKQLKDAKILPRNSVHRGEKKEKDPTKPKRPLTSYFLFLAKCRRETPFEGTAGEQSKHFGEMWKSLSEKEKEPFEKEAAVEKENYNKLMEVWKKDQPDYVEDESGKMVKKTTKKSKKSKSDPEDSAVEDSSTEVVETEVVEKKKPAKKTTKKSQESSDDSKDEKEKPKTSKKPAPKKTSKNPAPKKGVTKKPNKKEVKEDSSDDDEEVLKNDSSDSSDSSDSD